MAPIPVIIDSRIRVRIDDLPESIPELICEALTIENVEKTKAERVHDPAVDQMPDDIVMWDVDGDYLTMPRGYLNEFRTGMAISGLKIDIDDNRIGKRQFPIGLKPTPRDYQVPAIKALIDNYEMIWKAPPAAGKTVSVLCMIRKLGMKALVIVNTKDIANQWRVRIEDHLGENYPVGFIGDGEFNVSDGITVATQQTLWSRREDLQDEGFFDLFGIVCLDECHSATAYTYAHVVNLFSALYRFGVSATPDKTGNFELAELILGTVKHVTTRQTLVDHGVLTTPKIVRVTTSFNRTFRAAIEGRQSNYNKIIGDLVTDEERNLSIVGVIMKESGHRCLALTDRLKHIDLLEQMLLYAGYLHPIYRYTGKESRQERHEITEKITEKPGVIFSTLAKEALDVPALDRELMMFPHKNVGVQQQKIGRVERVYPGKEDAIVYDWVDADINVLKKQWAKRKREIYNKVYKIENTLATDYIKYSKRAT